MIKEFTMKNTVRIISLLLVAIMCMALAACGGDNVPTSGNAPATGTTEGTATQPVTTEEEEELLEIPEGAYYEGYEFRILGKDAGDYSNIDIVPNPDVEEDPINDAVYERNNKLEELFGITIVGSLQSAGNIVNTVKNNVSAQTDAYDLICVEMSSAFTLARDGCLSTFTRFPI